MGRKQPLMKIKTKVQLSIGILVVLALALGVVTLLNAGILLTAVFLAMIIALSISVMRQIQKLERGKFEASEKSKDLAIRSAQELERKVRERTEDLGINTYFLQQSLRQLDKKSEELKEYSRGLEVKVKERTAALEAAKNKSEVLLASIGDGVFAIENKALSIIHFNRRAEELSGYKASEVLGKPYFNFLKFVKERDRNVELDFIVESLRGEVTSMGADTLLIGKDNKEVPVADTAAPLKNAKGEILGTIVVFRDASEKRKIEHMKSEFSSLVAHQLRTPLGIIRAYVEILVGKGNNLTKDQRESLDGITSAAKRLLGLVDDLLSLSRLEEGRTKTKATVVDPEDLIEEIIRNNKQLFERKDQKFVFKKPASFPKLKIDPKLVGEAIKNLLSNASKYTPKKGKIELEVFQIHSELIFRITDSGVGIPEKEQSKVFERFFRASNAKATEKGTGLGLYISKLMIELSGGRIWFESKENEGTTFFFALPVLE